MDDLVEFVRPLREIDLVEPTPVETITARGLRLRRRMRARRRLGGLAAIAIVAVIVVGALARPPAPATVESAGQPGTTATIGGTVPAPPASKGPQRWLLGPDEYQQLPAGMANQPPHADAGTTLDASSDVVAIVEPVVGLPFQAGMQWEVPNRQASATFAPAGDLPRSGRRPDAVSLTVAQLTGPVLPPTLATQADFDAVYQRRPDGTELLASTSIEAHRSYAVVVATSGAMVLVTHETWGVPRTAEEMTQLAFLIAEAIDVAGWLPFHLDRTTARVPAKLENRPLGSTLIAGADGTIVGYILNEDLTSMDEPPVYDGNDDLIGYSVPRIGFVDRATYEAPDFDRHAEELARFGPEAVAERNRVADEQPPPLPVTTPQ